MKTLEKIIRGGKSLFLSSLLLSVPALFADDSQAILEIPEGQMALEEAFDIALKNNPGIDRVEQRILNAEATVKRAKSYLYPTIGVSASQQIVSATMQPDWNPISRVSMDLNQFDAGINFSWKLFDGLQDIHYLRAARRGLESAIQQHLDAQRVLKEQVSQAFIQSELAKEQMKIAKSNYEFNRKLEADAALRYEVGEIPEANVLNFSLALIQAESNYESAARDYQIACTVIAQLLSFDKSVLPKDKRPKADLRQIGQNVYDFEEEMSKAMTLRPDLKSIIAGVEGMGNQVKALQGTFMPSLSLFGGFRYKKIDTDDSVDQDEHDGNVGLKLNWALFDGGRRKARTLEMIASKNEMFHQQRLLVDSISSEIKQCILDLETSQILLEKSIRAEQHGRKIRDSVEKSYLAGSASITRLNEAQNNWVKTSSMLVAARLQILLNQYKLQSATGQIL